MVSDSTCPPINFVKWGGQTRKTGTPPLYEIKGGADGGLVTVLAQDLKPVARLFAARMFSLDRPVPS